MALTRTSFHPVFIGKVRTAMREAAIRSANWTAKRRGGFVDGQAYVTNRRGRPMLAVRYNPSTGYRVYDRHQRDVTTLVASTLQTI